MTRMEAGSSGIVVWVWLMLCSADEFETTLSTIMATRVDADGNGEVSHAWSSK